MQVRGAEHCMLMTLLSIRGARQRDSLQMVQLQMVSLFNAPKAVSFLFLVWFLLSSVAGSTLMNVR